LNKQTSLLVLNRIIDSSNLWMHYVQKGLDRRAFFKKLNKNTLTCRPVNDRSLSGRRTRLGSIHRFV